MINTPIFNKLPPKIADTIMTSLITIMYIAICAEADIFVPAFPQMIKFFGVAENQIQLILSINLAGLCITGLVVGPLSDSFGRRKTLLIGLFLFVVSSLGCCITDNFSVMLFWRLLQGIAASVPMVVGIAAFFDKYEPAKAGQLLGILNAVISSTMAGAPILGAYISEIYNWCANFYVMLALALISFIGTLFFIEETLVNEKRKIFSLKNICSDYLKISKNLHFLVYTMIASFPFIVIMLYISNASVIFVNYFNMDLVKFSYYQATTMGSFIIFSFISAKLIGIRGTEYTKNIGSIIALFGSVCILLTAIFAKDNVNLICTSMAIVAGGGALLANTWGMKAIGMYPDITGTAMAMMTAIRQAFSAGFVLVSEIFFNGTIIPAAVVIFIYALILVISYIMLNLQKQSNH